MKIHTKWRIPAESGELLINEEDLNPLKSINGTLLWKDMNEVQKIEALEEYLDERFIASYAIVDSFTEMNE